MSYTRMGRFYLFSLLLGMAWCLKAQPTDGLVAYYSFDGCDATEDTGSGANGVITGGSACGCGAIGNGLRFNGNTMVQILGNLDILFVDDYTISFYFLPEPQNNSIMNILSKSLTCGIDSTLELRYNPVSRETSLSMSQHALLSVKSAHNVPDDRCFHHITFVRQNRDHIVYYDGVQQNKVGSMALVRIENNAILTLGGSPCLANGQVPFRGVLDELRFYNRALTAFEVAELYAPVDKITSPDTVLFTGTSMQVRLPATCASSIQWSPATGVVSTNDAEPVISPVASQTYFVNLNYGFCQATDSIRITIADSSDLDCEKVFFPTGFTPNGDNLNDTWGLSNIVFLGQFGALHIYDRWGGEIFSTTDPMAYWDGTYQGEELMPGQYVYQFLYTCEGQERKKVGSFVMIR